MAKIIERKERICIKDAVNVFGCVRKRSLVEYAELINKTKYSAQQLVDTCISETMMEPFTVEQTKMVKSSPQTELSIVAADAFDIYLNLLKEASEDMPELMVSRGRYPYNFVATVKDTTNLILMFDYDGPRRLVHHNRSEVSQSEDPHENLVLGLPTGYGTEHMAGIRVLGRYRIALVKILPQTNTAKCVISGILEG